MKRILKLFAPVLAALAIATPALGATEPGSSAEQAAAPEQFAALQGVEAAPLSPAEMDAIHGALTGQDLFNSLVAKANLIRDPALRERTLAYLSANQVKLVAYFDRLLALFRR